MLVPLTLRWIFQKHYDLSDILNGTACFQVQVVINAKLNIFWIYYKIHLLVLAVYAIALPGYQTGFLMLDDVFGGRQKKIAIF